MIARCKHASVRGSERYLGRGITVCEGWLKFENFLADMGERPSGMSIDRIDNNLGYTPDNCKWSTAKEQMNNRSNNRIIVFDGRSQTLAEWARELGVQWSLLNNRLTRGWPVKRALTEPVGKYSRK